MALEWGTRPARLTLAATITASGVAFLDGTVVNVALPRIGEDLDAGLSELQWIVDGYLLTLGALVLAGGALGDHLGKRRVFLWGILGFGLASALCALAPTAPMLIVARLVQGAAAALLVPGSLAILSSAFAGADRGRAIGLWSGMSGVFTALGPFAGGVLVDAFDWGWRLVFLINVPLLALAWWLTVAGVPELPGRPSSLSLWKRIDGRGAVLAALGLGLVVHPLIEWNHLPRSFAVGELVLGLVVLAVYVVSEHLATEPMMPLGLFTIRSFSVANLVTFAVYAGLGGAMFLLSLQLQLRLGYGAVAAGASLLPLTVILLAFSSRVGAALPRVGARAFLTGGPLLMAAGLVGLSRVAPGTAFWSGVLPWVVVFSVGLLFVVAPVTTTVLGDVPMTQSGVASGVNNAVARVAGLIAVAVLPLAGTATLGSDQPGADTTYANGMLLAGVLCVAGAIVALVGLPGQTASRDRSSAQAEA